VHADQVLAGEVEMMLSNLETLRLQLCRKEDEEDVAGIFVQLGPLILMPDILERQLMELERLLE
jgi:hypothetical protein